MKYFVWIKTNDKICPQLWSMDFSKPIETRLGTVLSQIELTEDDQNLTLNELIRKYSYEKAASNNDVSAGTIITV